MLKLRARQAAATGLAAGSETQLAHRNALLTSLLHAMFDLARIDEPDAVIQGICDAMVAASPHIRLVWAWHGEPETKLIQPMMYAGPAAAYARDLRIERNYITLKGPAFRALLNDHGDHRSISSHSPFAPWRHAAKQYGFAVAGAFPLRVLESTHRGILIFYADDEPFFRTIGMDPFIALAKLAEASLLQFKRRLSLEAEAVTDHLTGLHNRRFMDRGLEQFRRQQIHRGTPFVLLLIDIDNFKTINDTYGHPRGDEVLVKMAQTLRQNTRAEDLLARWGGEEFILALCNTSVAGAMAWAERIRQIFASSSMMFAGVEICWTVSIGVAGSQARYRTIQDLMISVDKALYEAKTAGRNKVMQTCVD